MTENSRNHESSGEGEAGQGRPLRMSPAGGCLLAAALGLAGIALIFALGTLLTAGEMRFGQDEAIGSRLWLVNEGENRGFGWSSATIIEQGQASMCVQTHVQFLLWSSDGSQPELIFCDCYEQISGRWMYKEVCPDGR